MVAPAPEPRLDDEPERPSLPIVSLSWAAAVPPQLSPGPGCVLAVRARTALATAHGYAHVWHPATARVATQLGLAVSPEVTGTGAAQWEQTRRAILERPLKFLGDRGLGGAVLSALDLAMWDLRCRERGTSIESLLGTGRGPTAAYSGAGLQPWNDVAACERAAAALVEAGFEAVKVWVTSRRLAAERERLAAVREVIGPERRLFIDAGAAYDVESALPMLELAAEFGVAWVEDPIPRGDLAGMAALAGRSPVPLAGGQDADVAGLAALLAAAPLHTALIDLQQVGGISGWLAATRRCAEAGVRPSSHAYTHMGARLLAGADGETAIVQHADWDDEVFGPVPLEAGAIGSCERLGAVPPPLGALEWVSAS